LVLISKKADKNVVDSEVANKNGSRRQMPKEMSFRDVRL